MWIEKEIWHSCPPAEGTLVDSARCHLSIEGSFLSRLPLPPPLPSHPFFIILWDDEDHGSNYYVPSCHLSFFFPLRTKVGETIMPNGAECIIRGTGPGVSSGRNGEVVSLIISWENLQWWIEELSIYWSSHSWINIGICHMALVGHNWSLSCLYCLF